MTAAELAAATGPPDHLPSIGPRELPLLTPLNTPFWTGGRMGSLQIYRCRDCRTWLHPPRPRCPHCGSFSVAPELASGQATLFSYVVNHYPWRPQLTLPYVIALVELNEQRGLRLTTNLVECARADIEIGMPLEVVFEQHDQHFVPLFRPARAPSPGAGSQANHRKGEAR